MKRLPILQVNPVKKTYVGGTFREQVQEMRKVMAEGSPWTST